MTDKLKVAIVGCGRIASAYLEAFKLLEDDIEVIAACDIKAEKSKAFANEFSNCKAFVDYEKCLELKPDVIHIATPHHLHKSMAMSAMNKGIHVLTEKPMAIYVEDANEMIECGKTNNVTLGVIYQTRFSQAVKALKSVIDSGKLGKILAARSYLSWSRSDTYYSDSLWKGTWEHEGGGVLIDQAIHSIDRVQYLVGDKVNWIEASMKNRNHSTVHVEDVAEAFIQFEQGCLYQLYACNCFAYDAPIEIEIVGEHGSVGLVQDTGWVELKGEERYTVQVDGEIDYSDKIPNYWGSNHVDQLRDFYASIHGQEAVAIDGEEGRKSLEIVRGIYQSAILGHRVCVEPKITDNEKHWNELLLPKWMERRCE